MINLSPSQKRIVKMVGYPSFFFACLMPLRQTFTALSCPRSVYTGTLICEPSTSSWSIAARSSSLNRLS